MLPTIPAFGETNFTDLQSTKSTRVVNICDVPKKAFCDYCQLLSGNGWTEKEKREEILQEMLDITAEKLTLVGGNLYDGLEEVLIELKNN